MKTFYLLISNPLPSDSEVLFFKTLQEAEAKRTELRALLNEEELGIELGETSYANYYVAEFSEQFDQSRVTFFHTLCNAGTDWNLRANEWVKLLNASFPNSQVSRINKRTWQDEDDNLLYDESINTDGSWDIFCAFDQNYSTLRIGRVSYEG
jgi:hypothetical protein